MPTNRLSELSRSAPATESRPPGGLVSTLADIAVINRALKAAPFDLEGPPASAANRRALWDALLGRVHHEIAEHGRAALVARPSADGAMLFVEGAQGRLRGAFRDPLGLAAAMLARGLGRVLIEGAPASLDTVVFTLLAGPFEPVPGLDGELYACADRFVDRVEEGGLPVLAGVTWERARVVSVPAVATAEGFANGLRGLGVEEVIRRFEAQARSQDGAALRVSVRAMMVRARAFNEGDDDVVAAAALWSACARALPPGEDRRRVIAIMRSVARQRSEGVGGPRDIDGAVLLWQAVYRVAVDPDEGLRMVKSMMKVANLLTDLGGPWEAVDVPAAVRIWQGVWALHRSPDDDARLVRSMMDVANKLIDLRTPSAIRVEPAIAIWRGLLALEPPAGDRDRAIATMMDLARRLADEGEPATGLQDALQLWEEVYRLEGSAEGRLGVIKHMMAAANRRSQAGSPAAWRDLEGAFAIWRAIEALSLDDEDREVVALTRMSVARAMIEAGEVPPALRLWEEAFISTSDAHSRLRTVKTVLGLASSSPTFASRAAALLGEGASRDADFALPVLAGLRYYARDFEGVLGLAASSRAPAVAALAADALRKLGRLDEAVVQAEAVLGSEVHDADLVGQDARISALCCRAYCRLEQARAGADTLAAALVDLRAAADIARRAGLSIPPRVHTGLGYALRAQGREAEAEAAFAEALRLDEDNRKALAAGPAGLDRAAEPPTQTSGHLTIDAFEAAARSLPHAEDVAALLGQQADGGIPAAALDPYTRAVVARARQLHKRDRDVEGATLLWSACAQVLSAPEDHRRIVAVMRAVARQRSEAGDHAGAVHILEAVHRVAREPDQRLAVLKSMMHVANLHTDLSRPWREVDVPAAIALWRGAWRLHHTPDDDARVIRTMMGVAAMLARGDEPRAARVEAAGAIWRAVAALEGSGERVGEG